MINGLCFAWDKSKDEKKKNQEKIYPIYFKFLCKIFCGISFHFTKNLKLHNTEILIAVGS